MIIPAAMNNHIQAKRVCPGQESNPTSIILHILRQFKFKSHIKGHPQKVENQRFHLTPSVMGFKAKDLLLELLAHKKGARCLKIPHQSSFPT